MSTTAALASWPGLIAAYADRVAVPPGAKVVTLLEGGTPLVPADTLSDRVGAQVYLKVEGANPTGSFKDRGMTVAVTHALASGARAVICASTGNTSASAAAYAARAGLTSAVLVPQGKIAAGKLAQAVAYGARILQIEGNFDDCLELARKTAASHEEIALVNSVNPVRIEGQKTAAFEICDTLGRAPDLHYPAGRQRRQHHRVLEGLPGVLRRRRHRLAAADVRLPGRRRRAAGARPPRTAPGHHRHRHPDRGAGVLDRRHRRQGRLGRADRHGHRRADPGRLPAARLHRGGLRRAGLRRLGRRDCWPPRRTAGCRPVRSWSAPSPATA